MINEERDLVINLSQYFGYDCIIEISPWDKGITWTGIAAADIQTITDISELGVPFVAICKIEEAKVWLASFPAGAQEKLIEYDLNTEGRCMYFSGLSVALNMRVNYLKPIHCWYGFFLKQRNHSVGILSLFLIFSLGKEQGY